MEDQIKVSVITACKNSESTIKDTFQSILKQKYRPLQYIVVDGLSTDGTVNIIEEYKEKFQHEKIDFLFLSETDAGIYDAMNKGIRLATGDLVGIINSDDWYEEDAVGKVAKAYAKQPFDLFYADLRIINQDGSSFTKKSKNSKWITSRYWNHPTTFITKELYRNNLYKTENIHDDWDLILRIRKQECRIVVLNEVLANFRRNGVSHQKSWRKAMERAKIKYQIYRENGYSRLYFVECYGMEIAKLVV